MRQRLEIRQKAKFSIKKNLEILAISTEILVVATVISFYIRIPVTTKMEYCQECSVTISRGDSSVYILNGGDVLCITKSGSFSGRILRWTGSQELLICNEGEFLSKNVQLNSGINKINNYGIFKPKILQIYPGTKQTIFKNYQNATFSPKHLHLLNSESKLDAHPYELTLLSQNSLNQSLRTFGSPPQIDGSLQIPNISCWPSFSTNSFDFSLPMAWSPYLKEIKLERSEDGIHFYTVNTETFMTASQIPSHQIHIQDSSPLPGSSYYRLKVNNIENQDLYSQTISVSWIPDEYFSTLSVNLNFSKTIFYIHTDINLIGAIAVYDHTGKRYVKLNYQLNPGPNQILLDVGSLPPGIYWAGFESEEIEIYYPYVSFRRT